VLPNISEASLGWGDGNLIGRKTLTAARFDGTILGNFSQGCLQYGVDECRCALKRAPVTLSLLPGLLQGFDHALHVGQQHLVLLGRDSATEKG